MADEMMPTRRGGLPPTPPKPEPLGVLPDDPDFQYDYVESTAPGKFILSGEYSVIYNRVAIAASIDLTTKCKVVPNRTTMPKKLRLTLKALNYQAEWNCTMFASIRFLHQFNSMLAYDSTMVTKIQLMNLPRGREIRPTTAAEWGDTEQQVWRNRQEHEKRVDDAVTAFLIMYVAVGDSYASHARPAFDVCVDSTVPVASGLGSSTAYSAAVTGALLRAFNVSAEPYLIMSWSNQLEKLFHGRIQGLDGMTVCYGGYMLFADGKRKASGPKQESKVRVMLIDTKIARRTKDQHSIIHKKHMTNPRLIDNIMNTINDKTRHIWECLNSAQFTPSQLNLYIQANQELLDHLGLGHERIKDICHIAQKHDLAAKMTGAGGGGACICLFEQGDPKAAAFKEEVSRNGYAVYECECGGPGLQTEVAMRPAAKRD